MDFYGRPTQQFNTFNPAPVMVQPQPAQMRTNKIFVTSLEDALNRYAEPNTIMVYRHQDEMFEYEIMTDGYGKKTYKTLKLGEYSTPQGEKQVEAYKISTEDYNALKQRIEALEHELVKKYKEDRRNEKNGGKE